MTGQDLKAYRNRLGLSLAEASRAIGISQRTWCRWENLERLPKKIELLARRIAKPKN